MEPVFNILPLDFSPQQNEFFFEEENLKFTSKFDSGNMLKVEKRIKDSVYFVDITSDCYGTQCENSFRNWFFFSVKNYNNDKKKLHIYIQNMSNMLKFFREGYKFVYRITENNYNIDDKYEENEEFLWRRYYGRVSSEVNFFHKIFLYVFL